MILFKIVEPLLFREGGEIDPWISGVYSSAKSTIFPSPSTLVGAVATYFKEQGSKLDVEARTWYDEILSLIPDEVIFKGPFLKIGRKVYVGSKEKEEVYDLEVLIEYINHKKEELWNELVEGPHVKENVLKELKAAFKYNNVLLERTSIGLNRKTRTVKKGLLYTLRLVDFSGILKKYKISTSKVAFFLETKNFYKEFKVVSNLGGRGRIAIIETSTESIIDKFLDDAKYKKYILYFVSDCLIKQSVPSDLKKVFEESFVTWDWIFLSKIFERKAYIKGGKISIGVKGAGFSLRKKVRKPIYTALFNGSLLAVEFEEKVSPMELFWEEPAKSEAWKLGFGTFIPFPVE
ncbi:MAG: hypothetical protein DRJ47_07735 [Thermoprotei archaeon]|nr:MAG: hypothetical protein DRJ47_07735 [Thermoprotei archaeon]